jgi:hypothetical protein
VSLQILIKKKEARHHHHHHQQQHDVHFAKLIGYVFDGRKLTSPWNGW